MKWGGPRAQAIRAQLALTLPRPCWRCGYLIQPGDRWDVGHVVSIVEGGAVWDPSNLAPEHATCNRADGARIRNRGTRAARRLRS